MWTPKEVRKLIAQIAGILFGIGGIALMIADVKATGKINISTTLVSGQIESGSAGLLLLFFSFFLVIMPSFSGREITRKKKKKNSKTDNLSLVQKDIIISIVGGVLTSSFFIISPLLNEKGYTGFSTILLIVAYLFAVLTVIGIIAILFDFVNPENENIENEKKEEEK
jgi:hypothetical protein